MGSNERTVEMTYREFLEMRRSAMEREKGMREVGSVDHAFWKGRMLSYQDALNAVNGTTLLRDPAQGGDVKVEPAATL